MARKTHTEQVLGL